MKKILNDTFIKFIIRLLCENLYLTINTILLIAIMYVDINLWYKCDKILIILLSIVIICFSNAILLEIEDSIKFNKKVRSWFKSL